MGWELIELKRQSNPRWTFQTKRGEKASFELEEYEALKRVYKIKFRNSVLSYRCEIDSE